MRGRQRAAACPIPRTLALCSVWILWGLFPSLTWSSDRVEGHSLTTRAIGDGQPADSELRLRLMFQAGDPFLIDITHYPSAAWLQHGVPEPAWGMEDLRPNVHSAVHTATRMGEAQGQVILAVATAPETDREEVTAPEPVANSVRSATENTVRPLFDAETTGTEALSAWPAALSSSAEERVDSALRTTGTAVVLLGLLLAGLLSWQRWRDRSGMPTENGSSLVEQGRLTISPTCRLHLVRAGSRDVLVAVDRGMVKGMTPLPADFSRFAELGTDDLEAIAADHLQSDSHRSLLT